MKLRLYIVFTLVYLYKPVSAQIIFEQKTGEMNLGKKLDYFVDSNQTLQIGEVIKLPFNKKISSDFEIPNLQLTNFNFWFKFQVKNYSEYRKILLVYDQPILNDIILYKVKNGVIDSTVSGERVPISDRQFKYNIPVFEVVDDSSDYYLKIRSIGTLQLDLKLATVNKFVEARFTKNLLLGIYYGILIVMFFYNFFIYFTVRDKTYIYYSVYMIVLIVTQLALEGYGNVLLWPDNLWLTQYAILLFSPLVNITGILFANKFLNVKENIPILHKASKIVLALLIFILAVNLFYSRPVGYYYLRTLMGLSATYLFVTSIVAVRKKIPSATYFLLSWSSLIAALVVYILRDAGVLEHNNLTNYALQIGTAIEVTLLSFALGDKIRQYRVEKEISQAEAVRVAKLNEEILAEQNVFLEHQVKERTSELNKTLSDLKLAQTKLVDTEKMSSLGQLTAGIAHEINNPINFVSSNIKPLKRDVQELLDIVQESETLYIDAGDTEMVAKLNAIKKKYDFDYLKEEIPLLFDAIQNGAERTAEIVKGLKSFSRVDEQSLRLSHIHEGIDSTLMLLKTQMAGIIVSKEYGEIPLVECFIGKMNQVFMNILSNSVYALSHSKETLTPLEIKIKTYNDDINLYMEFSDNGSGISEENVNKIFEPFFTTKPVGDGTGLGLSIVYSIIEMHKGQIIALSNNNFGTLFKITIPLKQE
ncbi:MAG: 7TM diverse intracellular signaling domain-containing protein [Bacteroidota bacterium]|nr:7TM diverse intracellular signaling domain-containing protein [Bacteroidota bacterium]